ncbi:MAG: hypothetical protein SGJ05_10910 [bacterium]|nr:hypothetical protein [bacterium]
MATAKKKNTDSTKPDATIEMLDGNNPVVTVHGAMGSTDATKKRIVTHLYVEHSALPFQLDVKDGKLMPRTTADIQRRIVSTLCMDETAARSLLEVLKHQLEQLKGIDRK